MALILIADVLYQEMGEATPITAMRWQCPLRGRGDLRLQSSPNAY
jgi:hypothetical protein